MKKKILIKISQIQDFVYIVGDRKSPLIIMCIFVIVDEVYKIKK